MTVVVAAAPQVALPYQFGARIRRRKLYDSSGSSAPSFALDGETREYELPAVGYSDGLLVKISGTWTIANAALVFKGGGIWNYLRRAVLDTPGQADPLDLDGKGIHILDIAGRDISIHRHTIGPRGLPTTLDTNAWADANLDSQLTNAVGAQTPALYYFIPQPRNAHDLRGTLSLGHGGQRTHLRLTPSAEADLVTVPANSDTSAMTVEVYQVFFDGAPAGVSAPPDGWAVVTEQIDQLIQAVGDQKVDIDPEGIILQVFCDVIVNDAPDIADVEKVTLNLDQRKPIDDEDIAAYLWWYEQAMGIRLPAGVVPFDREVFADDVEPVDPLVGGYRGRDWIYSDELVDFFPTIKLAAGTVLGGGGLDKIHTYVKRLVKL